MQSMCLSKSDQMIKVVQVMQHNVEKFIYQKGNGRKEKLRKRLDKFQTSKSGHLSAS